MARILSPRDWMLRIADSRPEPGPFTSTSTSRTPIFRAFSEARSAAFCAANGVDLREPLNPIVPAESQQSVSPLGAAKVTIVLLNEARMLTTALGTLRRIFFLLAMASPARVRDGFPRGNGTK